MTFLDPWDRPISAAERLWLHKVMPPRFLVVAETKIGTDAEIVTTWRGGEEWPWHTRARGPFGQIEAQASHSRREAMATHNWLCINVLWGECMAWAEAESPEGPRRHGRLVDPEAVRYEPPKPPIGPNVRPLARPVEPDDVQTTRPGDDGLFGHCASS